MLTENDKQLSTQIIVSRTDEESEEETKFLIGINKRIRDTEKLANRTNRESEKRSSEALRSLHPMKEEARLVSRTRVKPTQQRRRSLIFTDPADVMASCLHLCAVLRFKLNQLPLISPALHRGRTHRLASKDKDKKERSNSNNG